MIFLTGSTGFLGKNILNKLASFNLPVCCSYRGKLPSKLTNVTYIKADFTAPSLPTDIFKGCSIIIHCAGLIKGGRRQLMEDNYLATKRIIESAISIGCVKKIIYISSIDVLLLDTLYAQSKRLAEESVKTSGLNWIIVRPSLIFGKEDKKNVGLLNSIIKKHLVIPLPSSGNFMWEPAFVDDLADYILKFVQNNSSENMTFNVVGPEKISFKEIIHVLSDYNKTRALTIPIPGYLMKAMKFVFITIFGKSRYDNVFSSFQDKIISENNNSEKVFLKTKLKDVYFSV